MNHNRDKTLPERLSFMSSVCFGGRMFFQEMYCILVLKFDSILIKIQVIQSLSSVFVFVTECCAHTLNFQVFSISNASSSLFHTKETDLTNKGAKPKKKKKKKSSKAIKTPKLVKAFIPRKWKVCEKVVSHTGKVCHYCVLSIHFDTSGASPDIKLD